MYLAETLPSANAMSKSDIRPIYTRLLWFRVEDLRVVFRLKMGEFRWSWGSVEVKEMGGLFQVSI